MRRMPRPAKTITGAATETIARSSSPQKKGRHTMRSSNELPPSNLNRRRPDRVLSYFGTIRTNLSSSRRKTGEPIPANRPRLASITFQSWNGRWRVMLGVARDSVLHYSRQPKGWVCKP